MSASQNFANRLRPFRAYLIVGAVIVASVFIFGGKRADPKPASLPPVIKSFTIGSEYTNAPSYTGTVHARVESDLGFRVSGKIIEKLVDEGQHVSKGQPLMRLDPIDLSLASNASQQAVDAAKAERDRAIPDLKRTKELWELHAASQQEYERAQALADSATARLQAAEADARRAANEYDYAILKADADGVVTDVPADAGQVVTSGQVVVRLARDGTREAVINLPEQALNKAKNATDAYLYTLPDVRFPVKLRELSAMADKTIRTYQARYTLLDSGKEAPLGATVTVVFKKVSSKGEESFQVPLGSLYNVGHETNVWVINETDNTVALRPVTLLQIGEEMAGVTGDLKAGEKIVALGAHLLKPAQKIRLADATVGEQAK
ncbi:MAG: efflux RND transporter periplasmic adaptor subunit [Methylophilaceae bacterium]